MTEKARGRATVTVDHGTGSVETWTGELAELHVKFAWPGATTGWECRLVWHGQPDSSVHREERTG